MIEIENLSYTYPPDNLAIENLSLKLPDGEFIAIMGQNGAGKTTLVKHFNGLLKPQKGTVLINGYDTRIESVATLSKIVGFVFQNSNHSLFSETVENEIRFTLRNFNFSETEIPNQIENTLKEYNLIEYRDRSPFSLSGGEQKRLALASVLCVNPSIIVLDEPTIGQDASQKKRLAAILQNYVNEKKTVIIVTHDIEFVAEYIPRTIVMARGRIIADGPTQSILTNSWVTETTALQSPELTRFSKQVAAVLPSFPVSEVKISQVQNAIQTHFALNLTLKPQPSISPSENKEMKL